MQLQKLVLTNIRSYEKATITFPSGSLLLAGDIGSGKSSILLGIEFALFGIVRGELMGESLLRKGTDECSVVLSCTINNREVVIERGLKMSQRGIQQTSGSISIDGIREEYTPVELRSKIFSLLGYPQTNAKSMLYRYTVYTPQEELKRIIVEEKEARLDVLRKVFGMDAYQRIRENAQLYVHHLREEIIRLQTTLERLPLLQKEEEKLAIEERVITEELITLIPKQEQAKRYREEKTKALEALEVKRKEVEDKRKQLALLEQEKKNIQTQLLRLQDEKKRVLQKKELLEKDATSGGDPSLLRSQVLQLHKGIELLEVEFKQQLQEEAKLRSRKEETESVTKKFSELNNCPLCLQAVAHDHKESILVKEQEKRKELEAKLVVLAASSLHPQIQKKKESLEKLREHLQQAELAIIQTKRIQETRDQLAEIEVQEKTLLAKNEVLLQTKIDVDTTVEMVYKEKKTLLDDAQKKEHLLSQQEAVLHTKQTYLKEQKEKVILEKQALLIKEEELKQKQQLRNWFKDHFLNLAQVIEQHVLLAVQQQFNQYFQEWFSFLLEDEGMNARIDDSFTPLIEQNGYELPFHDLSGGERSSVALAYRLALNKVINQLVTTIHTRDVLVLDEPTDGFSTHQVDRLKDVLVALDVPQIILVSHEPKVESFVEHVIRIEKRGGISSLS